MRIKQKAKTEKKKVKLGHGARVSILKRLGFKISLFASIGMITVAVFALMFTLNGERITVEQVDLERNQMAVKALESTLNNYSEESLRSAKNLASTPGLIQAMGLGNASGVQSAVQSLATIQQLDVDFVLVSDVNGNILGSYQSNMAGLDLEYFKTASVAAGGQSATSYETDGGSGLCVASSCPILDSHGKVAGVLTAGYSLIAESFVDNIKDITGNEITVFLGDTRVNTTIMEDGKRAVGTTLDPAIAKTVLDEKTAYQGSTDILGAPYATAYSPLLDSDGNAIGAIFAGISLAEINASIHLSIIISAVGVTIITILAVLLLITYLRKRITNPLVEMEAASTAMAQGNLSGDITFHSNDELGLLADDFRATAYTLQAYIHDISGKLALMADGDMRIDVDLDYKGDFRAIREAIEHISSRLNKTLAAIDRTAIQLLTGAEQVSDGAQALASGAAEQAATVEELSSSIGMVAAQAAQNMESVELVSKAALDAEEKINEGNRHMAQLMSAMDEIKSASDRIAGITSTIDALAFQTNILALNAAVEAARAGESGKGFSVVAEEVRNLAAKSAQAAKETAELITHAVQAANQGSTLTNETANILKAASEKTALVETGIRNVETASTAQTQAIGQITQGLTQVSSVVQTNAATAQESSASSEELAALAQTLQAEISKFQLAKETTPEKEAILENAFLKEGQLAKNRSGKY